MDSPQQTDNPPPDLDKLARQSALRLLNLLRRLQADPEFQEFIQEGYFELNRDTALKALANCDDIELPKIRQAFTLWDDAAGYIAEQLASLGPMEPDLK